MELVDEINKCKNEVSTLLVNFTIGSGTTSDLEKKKSFLLDYAKLTYEYYFNKMMIDETNEDIFTWRNSAIQITLILLSDFNLGARKIIGFAETSEYDTIKIIDAIDYKLPYTFYTKFNDEEMISYLVQNSIISDLSENVILASIDTKIRHIDHWAKNWLLKEVENVDIIAKPSIELIDFNKSIIRAKRYDLEELMNFVNNQQFSAELDECLYAFNNQKWFICATGLGGVLEHLLYLVLEKNNMIDRNFPSNATISDYISYMKRSPIKMEKRQQTMIKNIFNIRNSVSHFNQGFTSKDQCTYLMNGIKDIFDNYYNKDFNISDN